MTQQIKKFVSVLAAASLFVTNAHAATILVTGNGSKSDNDVNFNQTSSTAVVQTNVATVTNSVNSSSTTGGNEANDNTGGDVVISTGDAKSTTKVENMLNQNMASIDCCEEDDVHVEVSGNGSDSDNEVKLDLETGKTLFQTNVASVVNAVNSDAKTGRNEANRSTGGDVTIVTGDATAKSDVSTSANSNRAMVGGGHHNDGGSLSAWIVGNGSDSENDIDLDVVKGLALVQDNLALVVNAVDSDAYTGKNEANDNTGGEVVIGTGDAKAEAMVENMVNFNAASIDCDCVFDTSAKISGNGSDSENEIEAEIEDAREVFQDSLATLANEVEADARTGKNEADFNTGSVEGSDPRIITGDAHSTTEVGNASNMNVFGGEWDFPEVEVNFNWAHFISFWM